MSEKKMSSVLGKRKSNSRPKKQVTEKKETKDKTGLKKQRVKRQKKRPAFAPVSEWKAEMDAQTCKSALGDWVKQQEAQFDDEPLIGYSGQFVMDAPILPATKLPSCQSQTRWNQGVGLPEWCQTVLDGIPTSDWAIAGGAVMWNGMRGHSTMKKLATNDQDIDLFALAPSFAVDRAKAIEGLLSTIRATAETSLCATLSVRIPTSTLASTSATAPPAPAPAPAGLDVWDLVLTSSADSKSVHLQVIFRSEFAKYKSAEDMVQDFDLSHVQWFYRNKTIYSTPLAYASCVLNRTYQTKPGLKTVRRFKFSALGWNVYHRQVWWLQVDDPRYNKDAGSTKSQVVFQDQLEEKSLGTIGDAIRKISEQPILTTKTEASATAYGIDQLHSLKPFSNIVLSRTALEGTIQPAKFLQSMTTIFKNWGKIIVERSVVKVETA
jgi:hypothetical protein